MPIASAANRPVAAVGLAFCSYQGIRSPRHQAIEPAGDGSGSSAPGETPISAWPRAWLKATSCEPDPPGRCRRLDRLPLTRAHPPVRRGQGGRRHLLAGVPSSSCSPKSTRSWALIPGVPTPMRWFSNIPPVPIRAFRPDAAGDSRRVLAESPQETPSKPASSRPRPCGRPFAPLRRSKPSLSRTCLRHQARPARDVQASRTMLRGCGLLAALAEPKFEAPLIAWLFM